MEYPKFKVCVRCFTFNHSKYITDAMNGFVMQQTDFPYVCCIVDDASKDGEQEVIRKYVSDNFDLSEGSCHFERETDYAFITYAQHKTNKNCYFAVLYLKENHYSIKKPKMPYLAEWQDGCEYHALCEGDDHWIDNTKLQHQIMFLDQNSDYGMVFTRSVYLKTDGSSRIYGTGYNCFRDMLLNGNTVPTATVCYRKVYSDLYRQCETIQRECKEKQWKLGDYPLWVFIGSQSKVKCLTEVTSCYLCLEESASHSANLNNEVAFLVSSKGIKDFLINMYFPNDTLLKIKSDRMFAWGIYRKYMLYNMPVEAYHFLSGYGYCLNFRMKFISFLMHNRILRHLILKTWTKQ